MTNELEKVRDWAEAKIKSGNLPNSSWQRHVALIEALDAVLHDVSLASPAVAARPARLFGGNLRLVQRASPRHMSAPALSDAAMQRKATRSH